MTEGTLETLRILAYLSIGLISIVIATYAISVSYLGREAHRSIWRKKRKRAELERKIKELGQKVDVKGIKEEIDTYEKEISQINDKLFFLSVGGAVILPSICFLATLLISVCNIYTDPTGTIDLRVMGGRGQLLIRDILIGWGIIAVAIGVFFLVKTLFAIEWAASRIPLPEFDVFFESGLEYEKCSSKEHKELTLNVSNKGEVLAENVQIFIFFPPDFKVGKKRGFYHITKQDSRDEYPSYNAAIYRLEFIHIGVTTRLASIPLDTPEKTGSYTIPVCVYERKIGKSEHELTIEIIKGKQTE